MRGPSSSHTAGSYHIGRTLRDLLGDEPVRASFTFDPRGSYARTFRQQAVDLALTAGLLGWPITDKRFASAPVAARAGGLAVTFRVVHIPGAGHPNTVAAVLAGRRGGSLSARAESTGGGGFVVSELDGWPVRVDGKAFVLLVAARKGGRPGLARLLPRHPDLLSEPSWPAGGAGGLLSLRLPGPPSPALLERLSSAPDALTVRTAAPVYFIQRGRPLFDSAAAALRLARRRRWTLGRTGLAYEAGLLAVPERDVAAELLRRAGIMREGVAKGLRGRGLDLQLLRPSAGKIWRTEQAGRLAAGGLHARAAARAMAVMHVSNSRGVVVAAPTGGSAGVIPGVLVTMIEEWKLQPGRVVRALAAAAAVGLILAGRATFAAEVAGCQVEIGAAGAMAAAAVVEAAGGTARQAADAAAIAFQNAMGSVCDLVQGMCEIPCHTRNAVAASGAFVCADLVLGGYRNPVPLDETIDAVFACGKMLPAELRCTARGGLAMAPSARSLPNLRRRRPA